MASEKVSLTLDQELLAAARANLSGRELSSYVNAALRRQLQRDHIIEYLDALDRKHGPVSDQILEEVRHEWPGRAKPKRRRTA